jgi:hypothetical protein
MSIDKLKTKGTPADETLFILRDPQGLYSHSDICDLLEKAETLGFSLEAGTELEKLTVRELDILVNRRQ